MTLVQTPWLHIRSQLTYHFEAEIRGSKSGLIALRKAVDKAIIDRAGDAAVFASDGEGYNVVVSRVNTRASLGDPPYLDELARKLAIEERNALVRQSRAMAKQAEEAMKALIWCRQNGNPHEDPTP